VRARSSQMLLLLLRNLALVCILLAVCDQPIEAFVARVRVDEDRPACRWPSGAKAKVARTKAGEARSGGRVNGRRKRTCV
jgi:hypothetical protein